MKYFLLALLCASCYANWGEYPPAPYHYRDDLYCWHKNMNDKWEVSGLAHSCPGGASYGRPSNDK